MQLFDISIHHYDCISYTTNNNGFDKLTKLFSCSYKGNDVLDEVVLI